MASTYSTWEYYHGAFCGTLSEEAYTRLAVKAAGEINRRTLGRAKTDPAGMAGALRDCECELAEALASFEVAYALLPKGINSIGNDGLSVSAGGREVAQNAEIRAICQKYLMEPENLMYAGI